MPPDQPARPDSLPRALGRLRVALEDTYTRVSTEMGLTAQQAELLCAALRPIAVGDLAAALRCDRSNVSRLVDRAADRGLLERRSSEEDGRVSMIQLTARGERLATGFIASLAEQLRPLLDEWSGPRQQAATRLLNQLADHLQQGAPNTRRRPAPHRPAGPPTPPDA